MSITALDVNGGKICFTVFVIITLRTCTCSHSSGFAFSAVFGEPLHVNASWRANIVAGAQRMEAQQTDSAESKHACRERWNVPFA
jgi:hypothetical protein